MSDRSDLAPEAIVPPGIRVVRRLFRRFVAMFGSQKVGAMFADVPVAEVHAAWADALDGLPLEAMHRAIAAMEREGRTWPPGSAEFARMVRDEAAAPIGTTAMLALPADAELASAETARAALVGIRELLRRTNVTAALSGPDPDSDGCRPGVDRARTDEAGRGAIFFPSATRHLGCGEKTRLTPDIARLYARPRPVYDAAYCRFCDAHFPLLDFDWIDERNRRPRP